jgi:protein-tyrosine phosphatase
MFVDCHSHVVPSGDDGVTTVAEGVVLCAGAARRGTRILFATPHVWPHLPLTAEREESVRTAFAELEARAPLDVRLGFELTPTHALLGEDPRRYVLDGTEAVLMEVPFQGAADVLVELSKHVEEAGLRPLIAHPERTEAVLANPGLAEALAARGWLLQVNSTSLLGRHGPEVQELAWRLVDEELAAVVASDGHRAARPPYLDEAFAAVRRRVGERAERLFNGSALGLTLSPAAARASG